MINKEYPKARQITPANDTAPHNSALHSGGKQPQGPQSGEPCAFVPARFIMAHSDIDRRQMDASLEKYNGENCTYAWKPIIIYEVCEKYGNCVYWFDTRSFFYNFINIIKILNNDYIYSPESGGDIKEWTHNNTIEYMDGYKYIKYKPRAGGIFGINYNIEWCKNLVIEWKNLALIKECISPHGSNRLNHRQDQSILSILYYKYYDKYNFKIIDHYIDMVPHYYNI
jgi:hypothetical protein